MYERARPFVLLATIAFIILLAAGMSGCFGPIPVSTPVPSTPGSTADPTTPVTVTLDPVTAQTVELPFTDANGVRTFVKEYPQARNVSLGRLEEFLAYDSTENTIYVMPNYTCVDFAKALHDAAEAHGIESAMVTVYFSDQDYGHCFNAFYTTDYGLVYIDDTGLTLSQLNAGAKPYDGVNYLVVGKALGWLPLVQSGNNFTYEHYVDRLAQFNEYVAEENQLQHDYEAWNDAFIALEDAHSAGTITGTDYTIQKAKLEQQGADITKRSIDLANDPRHKWVIASPMGNVSEVNTYW